MLSHHAARSRIGYRTAAAAGFRDAASGGEGDLGRAGDHVERVRCAGDKHRDDRGPVDAAEYRYCSCGRSVHENGPRGGPSIRRRCSESPGGLAAGCCEERFSVRAVRPLVEEVALKCSVDVAAGLPGGRCARRCHAVVQSSETGGNTAITTESADLCVDIGAILRDRQHRRTRVDPGSDRGKDHCEKSVRWHVAVAFVGRDCASRATHHAGADGCLLGLFQGN